MKSCVWVAAVVAMLSCGRKEPVVAEAPRAVQDSDLIRLDPEAAKAAGIQIGTVEERRRATAISANGRLTTNEDATWQVGALTGGKIMQVLARTGDRVQAGAVLAWMHSDDVHNTRAVFRQANSELQRRRVMLEHAGRVRDRTRRLFDLKAASREQLEAAETEWRNAEYSVRAAQTEIDKERTHLEEFLEVTADGSTNDAPDLGSQSLLPLRAPANGTVMDRTVTVGTVVNAGNPAFTISDLSTLWMIAAVNEADLAGVRPGQPVSIQVKAYPDRSFGGRVLKLGEQLDPLTRTLQARVAVPNAGGLLKPEMFATAEIASLEGATVLAVPEAAVQQVRGESAVFVAAGDGNFRLRRITAGPAIKGLREVVSGLARGERVVVKGAFPLKSELLKE